MRRKRIKNLKERILALIMTATVAICTLPFFIGTEDVSAAVLSSAALVSEANTKKAGYKTEKAFRDAILAACKKMDGVKYEWGGGGWNGLDCAGSVSLAYSVALKTAKISGTSGSYGNKTITFTGGGTPDKYGFEIPGYAGIKSSFTNGILKTRGIKPTENHFSSFETNGKKGIQNDEWIKIIDKYGFKPGDMILWWNDNNDKTNAQHITIYAGVENGVPKHWTASSTSGYFLKKSLTSSSSESGKGSFTGFMGLKATAMKDGAKVGFYIDKRDPSGINYTGCTFSVYKDAELKNLAGEIRDDDSDGIYSDYYSYNGSTYTKQKYGMTGISGQSGNYEDTLYVKETGTPTGVILPDGSKVSLMDQPWHVPDVYKFIDPDTYVVHVKLTDTDGSKGKLEYSLTGTDGTELYSFTKSDFAYIDGSNVLLITNMVTTEDTAGRGKGAGLFTDASALSLEKITSTTFDTTSVVFTVTEGLDTVSTYKYSDGSWNWYDASGNKWSGTKVFPVKYGTEYTVTETFSKDEPFKCIDGNTIEYEYTNDSDWEKVDDTTYQYKFKTGSISSKKTYSFKCENNKTEGMFSVEKFVSDEDDTRDGFVFELWNKDMTYKLAEGVSGEDGKVRWKTAGSTDLESFLVPAGDYILSEVLPDKGYPGTSNKYTYKIPKGFKSGTDSKWIKEIRIGADTVKESVTNDRIEGAVKIVKLSEDKLAGNVEFNLFYGGNQNEPSWQKQAMTKGKTDPKGILEFKNLPTGWYRIEEKAEPVYKAVWDDGTEGKPRIIRITEKDDNKVVEVKVTNKIDINPNISTELTDKSQSHIVNAGKNIALTDKVHLENLIAGYEYKLTGSLVDKNTGEVFKDRTGKEYTVSITFKADNTLGELTKDDKGRDVVTGDVSVTFYIDSSYLFEQAFENGKTFLPLVCVETLSFRNIIIAEHKDLEDEDQTIKIEPKISTTASDSNTNTGVLTLSEKVTINDKVSYEGLNPGDSFVMTGTLMDKATGKPYVDADGNTYTKEVPFIPDASSGIVIVCFEDVNVPLDQAELVAFESLKTDTSDKPIAKHEDINDKDQTLKRPSCKTVATTVKGDKTFLNNSTVTIVDHVSYSNLEVGREYYAKATLCLTDGTGVTNKGTEVVSLQKFEPEEPSGIVDVTIKFRSTGLEGGDTVVVIENIYDMSTEEEKAMGIQYEDVQVISHEDLNNKDQSLAVTDVPISGELLNPKTVAGFAVFFVSMGFGAYVIAGEIKRKKIDRKRKW